MVFGRRVVVRVHDDRADPTLLFCPIVLRTIVFARHYLDRCRRHLIARSVEHTVGSRDHPLRIDQGTTAEVLAWQDSDLPGQFADGSVLAADDQPLARALADLLGVDNRRAGRTVRRLGGRGLGLQRQLAGGKNSADDSDPKNAPGPEPIFPPLLLTHTFPF